MKKWLCSLLIGILLLGCLLIPLSAPTLADSPTPTPIPLPYCADFNGMTSSVVRAGGGSAPGASIYCTVIAQNGTFIRNAAELGNEAVISMGVIQAVDVYGLTNAGVAVPNFTESVNLCLQGTGTLIYLDAMQTPRVPAVVGGTASNDGYMCAMIPHAGTVALVSGTVAPPQPQPQAQGTPAPGETPQALQPGVITEFANICIGTTTAIVRLRTEPSADSPMIVRLPFKTTWRVTAHTPGWYRIVYLDGQAWVSDRYLTAHCTG